MYAKMQTICNTNFSDQMDYELRHRAIATLFVSFALHVTHFLKYYTPRDFGKFDSTQKKLNQLIHIDKIMLINFCENVAQKMDSPTEKY